MDSRAGQLMSGVFLRVGSSRSVPEIVARVVPVFGVAFRRDEFGSCVGRRDCVGAVCRRAADDRMSSVFGRRRSCREVSTDESPESNKSLQPTATAVVFRVGALFSDAVAVAELCR